MPNIKEFSDFLDSVMFMSEFERIAKKLIPKRYIKDLPVPIQELALKRQYEQHHITDSSKNLIDAFDFSKAPEGPSFWGKIQQGKYEEYYEKSPAAAQEEANKKMQSDLAPSFKNGEKVEARVSSFEWSPAKFIGNNDDEYAVLDLNTGILISVAQSDVRKPETKAEDKNAFISQINDYVTAREFSNKIFGKASIFQILSNAAPKDKQDLKYRAFYVVPEYEVTTGEARDGGTYIAIHKK